MICPGQDGTDKAFIVCYQKPTRVNIDELAPQLAERQRDIVSRMGFQYSCKWPIIK